MAARFTQAEDLIILNAVKDNPFNISRGLREASNNLPGRSFNGCSSRYYSALTKANTNGKKNFIFMSVSKKAKNINRKIVRADTQQASTINESKFKRIFKILFE